MNRTAAAQALYRQGEVHRLQGEFAAAEEAYRDASRGGWEPQPGLALLRLAQGDTEAASAAIRRVMGETTGPLEACEAAARLRRDHAGRQAMSEEARDACHELEEDLGGLPERHAGCDGLRTPRERSTWPTATPGLPWSLCVARGRCGRSSRCRTRPPACGCSLGWPAAPSATTIRPRWSSRRPAASSRGWEQRQTSPGSTRSPDAPRLSMPTG